MTSWRFTMAAFPPRLRRSRRAPSNGAFLRAHTMRAMLRTARTDGPRARPFCWRCRDQSGETLHLQLFWAAVLRTQRQAASLACDAGDTLALKEHACRGGTKDWSHAATVSESSTSRRQTTLAPIWMIVLASVKCKTPEAWKGCCCTRQFRCFRHHGSG